MNTRTTKTYNTNNNYKDLHDACRPVLQPIAALLITAIVMQPLSAYALQRAIFEKPQEGMTRLTQGQLTRIHQAYRDQEVAKVQKTQNARSPADKSSADLERISHLVQGLAADDRAAKRVTAQQPAQVKADGTTADTSAANTAEAKATEVRAVGPNMRIEVQRNTDKAFLTTPSARREQLSELQSLLANQTRAQETIRAEFAATRQTLVTKKLPAQILQRHDQAVQTFEQRALEFNHIAAPLTKADDITALQKLDAFLKLHPNTKTNQSTIDPKNPKLPWRSPEPTKRMPAETKAAWDQHPDTKSAGPSTGVIGRSKLVAKSTPSQAVRSAPQSAVGGVQFTTPPAADQAPQDADLAETLEVQLTPAIRAKAQSLNYNPVEIYNWVASNVVWQPTWGAIQNSDSTLSSLRGNALDIASLTIALMRASGIPARYQFGTIEIPAAQLNNWIGGAQKPEAALQLLAQGGIAARGVTEAGRITKVRMEHVWVNAYVNWAPGRGSKQGGAAASPIVTAPHGSAQHPNPNAALNAWVSVDASYKQYSYGSGMNLEQNVPFDTTAFVTAVQQGATLNAAHGYVQNLNQVNLRAQFDAYQTRLTSYVNATPTGTGSTVGDVIGKRILAQSAIPMLVGTTPQVVVSQGQEVANLPTSMQHQFRYELTDTFGNAVLSWQAKLSQLVGKRITLTYAPATQADVDVITSYLPSPNVDGSPIRPEQVPQSLPGYLIRLKAQINVDHQVVATSVISLNMGTELNSTGGFTSFANLNEWDLSSETSNAVGQGTAIGISAGGIGVAQLEAIKTRLQTSQSKLQSAQADPNGSASILSGLTGEQLSRDFLTATIWSWFAAAENHNRFSQSLANVVEHPGLSYGLFHSVVQPVYSWGIVRQVKFPGVNMDIGHIRNLTWSADNDISRVIGYNRARGQYMSGLEHAMPERFLIDPAKCNLRDNANTTAGLPDCPQGVSAVKAIAIAAAQGQKIYTITQEVYRNNPNIVSVALTNLSASTKLAIQSALDAGYEITSHETPITESGWTGAGYIFIDPQTGAGGYLIDGGSNGTILILAVFICALLSVLGLFLFPASAGMLLLFYGLSFGAVSTTILWLNGMVDVATALTVRTVGIGLAVPFYGELAAIAWTIAVIMHAAYVATRR